jgi:8-oxo-dGTP diphosphatase
MMSMREQGLMHGEVTAVSVSPAHTMSKSNDDRRRTSIIKGREVTFTRLAPGVVPPFEKVTSVGVVPFTTDGRIVVILQDRGIDIPGGHVQSKETSIFETARREAMEEAHISLRDLQVVQAIQSDYFGPDDLTYLVTVTGLVAEFHAFRPSLDSTDRLIMDVDDFLLRCSAGDVEGMSQAVHSARELLFKNDSSSS